MKRYYIKISGSAFGVEAQTKEEAIEQVRKIAEVYCSFNAQEIGSDCDENGYTIERSTVGERMRETQAQWESLNLTNPQQFPSSKEFVEKWTEPNQEQADARFNREKKQTNG